MCGDDDEDDNAVNPNEKMYAGQVWEPDSNGEISIRQWDMFINKAQYMKLVRDYFVQEDKNFVKLKNATTRYNVKYAYEFSSWRLLASTLPDGRTF